MKALTILLLSVCLLVGCGESIPNASRVNLNENGSEALNVYPTTIDGCEYFVTYVHGGKTLTHKGNCKNPIHSCQK